MTIRKHILYLALGTFAITGFTACETIDDDRPEETRNTLPGDSIHVRLFIDRRGSDTRAGDRPYGGETGDGWEFGSELENAVTDLCVFTYRSGKEITEITPSEAAALRLEGKEYATEDQLKKVSETGTDAGHSEYKGGDDAIVTVDFTFAKDEKVETTNLRFIVVANVGDIRNNVTYLKDVCDYQNYASWTVNADNKPTNFAMSSTANSYALGGEGTKEDPIRYHIDIERTAARIDYDFNGGTLDSDNHELCYNVVNAAGTENIASFYLQYVKIVNGCVLPTYMLKRVAKDVAGTSGFQYLGDETFSNDGTATNYVIDPRTALRTGTFNESWPDTWYKDTHMYTSLAENYANDAPIGTMQQFNSHIDWDATGTTIEGYTLGYVNENTFDKDQTVSVYATGLQLKGTYVPLKVYSDYDAENKSLTLDTEYTRGQSFWRFVKLDQPAEEFCLYFSSKAAADKYCAAYNKNNPSGGYVSDEYKNGLCYYYVWLRHANNSDDAVHGPMEFGIVRNNIYRLKISKVAGPGTVKPDPRNPEYLKAIIYVRKWREVTHPEIPM